MELKHPTVVSFRRNSSKRARRSVSPNFGGFQRFSEARNNATRSAKNRERLMSRMLSAVDRSIRGPAASFPHDIFRGGRAAEFTLHPRDEEAVFPDVNISSHGVSERRTSSERAQSERERNNRGGKTGKTKEREKTYANPSELALSSSLAGKKSIDHVGGPNGWA